MDMEWLAKAVSSLKERAKTLVDLAVSLRYYILDDIGINGKAQEKFLKQEHIRLISDLQEVISRLQEFTAPALEAAFESVVQAHGIKLGSLAQPVRVALTGNTASPGIFEVMEIMGKDKVMKRLTRVIKEG
jgi:glutamyl-tRNA synthetase